MTLERLLDPLASFRFPVLWVRVKFRRREVFLGFCGYAWRPFKIAADILRPLIIRDLFVNAELGLCEEAKRCLNTGCPLNRTTQESFMRSLGAKSWTKNWRKYWRNAQSFKDMTLTDLGLAKYENFTEPGIILLKPDRRRSNF